MANQRNGGGGGKGEKFYFNLRGHERLRTSAAYLIAQIHLNTHTHTHTGIDGNVHTHTRHTDKHTTRLCHLWFRICAYLDFSRTAGRLCVCVCLCTCATRPKQFVANYTALPSIVANSCVYVCVLLLLPSVGGIRNSFAHVAQRLLWQ